jgi:hypothetical protein
VLARYGVCATLASLLLAVAQGKPAFGFLWAPQLLALQPFSSPFAPARAPGLAPALALLLALVAAVLTIRRSSRLHRPWRLLALALICALWLAAAAGAVGQLVFSLTSFGPMALSLLRPYAISAALLLGYAGLLARSFGSPPAGAALPLVLSFPLLLAALALACPAVPQPAVLPLLAALALLPAQGSRAGEQQWIEAAASFLELAAMQTVAWGAALSLLGLCAELIWSGSYGFALFVGAGTGVMAWILSGLIWGLSTWVRQGRGGALVAGLARLAFGTAACPGP